MVPPPRAPLCVSKRAGFTLLELVIALGISGLMLAVLWPLMGQSKLKEHGHFAGTQAVTVAAAARASVEKNKSLILASIPNLNDAGEILVSDIQANGDLPSYFVNENEYGQHYRVFVKREDSGTLGVADDDDRLVVLVVSDGGVPMGDKTGNIAIRTVGAAGGFIFSDDPTTARGMAGSWQVDLTEGGGSSSWSMIPSYTPSAGHIVILSNFLPDWSNSGLTMPDFLLPEGSACDASVKARMMWDDTMKTLQLCDGTDWQPLEFHEEITDGELPIPSEDGGYFVITKGKWDGALGGRTGASAKCLSDLTANDWMGKSDAVSRGLLNSSHVYAWICHWNTCNQAVPNTTYYFAVSGDTTKGGASFTTDASGRGPGNTQSWGGTNYFSGSKMYWTGKQDSTDTDWGDDGFRYECCGGNGSWYVNSGDRGVTGVSGKPGKGRWVADRTPCDIPQHLVCFVHP